MERKAVEEEAGRSSRAHKAEILFQDHSQNNKEVWETSKEKVAATKEEWKGAESHIKSKIKQKNYAN